MRYFRHGDPLDDFNELDRKQAEEERHWLLCDDKKCRKPLLDYYFEIDGYAFCEDCMIRRYRRNAENY